MSGCENAQRGGETRLPPPPAQQAGPWTGDTLERSSLIEAASAPPASLAQDSRLDNL